MIDAKSIAGLIGQIEREVPGQPFLIDGVDWWPIARTSLYMALCIEAFALPNDARPSPGFGTRLGQLQPLVRQIGRGLWQAWRQRIQAPSDAIWLISDGVSYQDIGGHAFERYCGPLELAARQSNVPTHRLDPLRCDLRDLLDGEVEGIAHWTGIARLRGLVAARISPDVRLQAACDIVNSCLAGTSFETRLRRSALQAQIVAVTTLADRLEKRWRRCAPRAIAVVDYYSLHGFAAMLAAHRLGIASADIQHGVAGDLHSAYGGWRPRGEAGYALLPKTFLSWSETEAAAIDDWATGTPHRALVVGVPMIEAWRAGWVVGAEASANELQRHLRAGCRHALVTLQPGLAKWDALGPLLAAICRRRDIRWWLRRHPLLPEAELGALVAQLPADAAPRIDVDLSNRLPLYTLLSMADTHVTHSSSAVTEAALLGCHSIILSQYGGDLFGSEIAAEWARVALDDSAMDAALDSVRRPAGSDSPPGQRLAQALNSLAGRKTLMRSAL